MTGGVLAESQVAVVTGGAAGIGLALTRRLLERGLQVAVVDREHIAADQAAKLFGPAAENVGVFTADISNPDAVNAAASAVEHRYGSVDLLCNNAGTGAPKSVLWEQSATDFARVVGVNLLGTANVLRVFIPAMVARGRGHILTIASYLALCTRPGGGNAAYTASKHGVLGLSEVLSDEFAALDIPIGVTVVCPGPVDTALIKAAHAVDAQGGGFSRRLPSRAMGGLPMSSADEIARAALDAVDRGLSLEVVEATAAEYVRQRIAERLARFEA